MKINFTKEIIHSNKQDKDFYVVRYVLVNEKKEIIAKSQPLFWVSKDVYEALDF